MCSGVTSANLVYTSTTNNPTTYSINYDATAEAAGFVDVASTALGASPIVLTIPGGASADTYNAVITVSNGCPNTAAFTVTVNPRPVVDATATTPICVGSPLVLTAALTTTSTANYSYNWSGAVTDLAGSALTTYTTTVTNSATLADGIAYTVTVTDANGCTATDNVTPVVNSLPVATLTANAPCFGTPLTLTLN